MKAIEESPFMPKRGHLVKFHTPYHDEDPKQLYLLLRVIEPNDFYKTRADILALGTGFSFPPISMVNLEDLEVVEWNTAELLGNYGTVLKEDGSKVPGKIIQILNEEHKKEPLETLKIQAILKDEKGVEHTGRLLMDSLR
ncbi:hypothetical protein SYJ56_19225 [Algoriphagus sp. D3-2-R+10]|uniref:hypothetical protein n=1 Tax=Algoriphagus aurantiacus TaxID=3103948 RepID=UPI002B3E204B|nr:hypothetical protein [Algoriphagus sp. D3-2-R+10]MEB2777455.1 hypothetical protein [Algoriphagus sp. D3-2-R+10]